MSSGLNANIPSVSPSANLAIKSIAPNIGINIAEIPSIVASRKTITDYLFHFFSK